MLQVAILKYNVNFINQHKKVKYKLWKLGNIKNIHTEVVLVKVQLILIVRFAKKLQPLMYGHWLEAARNVNAGQNMVYLGRTHLK
jgi:hypothetical protein